MDTKYELGDRVWTCSHGAGTVVKLPDKDGLFHVYIDTTTNILAYIENDIIHLREYRLSLNIQKAFDMMKPLRDHIESMECVTCSRCPLRYNSNTCLATIINELFECRFD